MNEERDVRPVPMPGDPVERRIDGDVVRYASGSSRSADAETCRYDLIPSEPHRRLAERYGMGAKKHGDRNWEKGQPVSAVLSHLERHLGLWKAGDRSDDHLAAAAWGLYALMFFETKKPELISQWQAGAETL